MDFIEIQKVGVTPVDEVNGAIVNSKNIENKETNTYSAEIIDELVEDVYSTNETVVGTWIDGKPLYRKVIDCGNLPNANGKNVAHNISNIKKIISIDGISEDQWNGTIKIPFIDKGGTNNIQIYVNKADIQFSTNKDYSSWINTYVILEYTKTTD